MRQLTDEKTNLIIRNFTAEELEEKDEIKDTINSWSDDEKIKEYITSNCLWSDQLYDHLYGLNEILNSDDPQYSSLYFVYDYNEQLLAIAQLSKTKSKFNHAIQYVAVNPYLQNRGIGSRLLTSINNNPHFFNKEKSEILLSAASKQSNLASRRILKKQGFIPYKKMKDSTLILYARLWKPREMGE